MMNHGHEHPNPDARLIELMFGPLDGRALHIVPNCKVISIGEHHVKTGRDLRHTYMPSPVDPENRWSLVLTEIWDPERGEWGEPMTDNTNVGYTALPPRWRRVEVVPAIGSYFQGPVETATGEAVERREFVFLAVEQAIVEEAVALHEELVEVLRAVLSPAPTVIPPVDPESCAACGGRGQVNIGTPVDPEPGPCPQCSCDIHRENHPDCIVAAERLLDRIDQGRTA